MLQNWPRRCSPKCFDGAVIYQVKQTVLSPGRTFRLRSAVTCQKSEGYAPCTLGTWGAWQTPVSKCLCLLSMGLIYALNLEYPNTLKDTFEVFHNLFSQTWWRKTTQEGPQPQKQWNEVKWCSGTRLTFPLWVQRDIFVHLCMRHLPNCLYWSTCLSLNKT